MRDLNQLVYHNLNLVQEVCKVVLGVLVIRGIDCVGIKDSWGCDVWDWELEQQYRIQIFVYICLLRWRRNCMQSVVAIWFDEVNSRIVYIISNGISLESVENIEGLSGDWCVWRLSKLRIKECSWLVMLKEFWSLLGVIVNCSEFCIRSNKRLESRQIVQCSIELVCWQMWQILG